jgi:hypothetical protein
MCWLFALVGCGCAHLHTPAGPLVPDRPGFTDTPTVLPAGAVQVEGGVTSDQSGDSRYQSLGELLLRVGVPGQLEFRLFANSFGVRTVPNVETVQGMEDVKVGVKFRLIAMPDSVHGLTPSLALFVATTLPTGARSIGAAAAQPEAKLAASWTTSSPFSFYTNAGYGAVYDGTAWSDHGWGSLATWFAATPRLSLFFEGIHVQNVSGPAASSSYVDGGLTLLFGDRLQIDARIGRGAGSPVTSERFVGLGLARRF